MSASFTTRPTLSGTFGMVSSTHWLASQAAMRMLELGGNAADAATAGGFVLQVVEPHLNGPGGDLPAIIATAGGTVRVLCGQGPAPAAATAAHFADQGMTEVPGAGPLATAVPGAVDAWLLLLRDHGTLPPAEVLAPAVHYARHGHPFLASAAATIERVADLFESDWTTSAQVWLPGGRPPRPGELFTNRAWADTLQRLLDQGRTAGADRVAQIEEIRRAWSTGFVAEAVDSFARRPFRHPGGQVLPGVLTGADLAAYRATWEQPLTAEWHGHTVAKTGPWGQGPTLLQVLAMLDALDDPAALDPDQVPGVHAAVEAWKLAMADREAWLGDADPQTAVTDDLLDAAYLRARAGLLAETASLDLRPGSPGGRVPRVAAAALRSHAGERATDARTDGTTGEPTVARDGGTRGDTCHLDVVDRWGTMISATPSGGWLQSSPVVPELGFALGSRLQMTWLEQGLASSLVPGRRPRTTLSPTLLLRDGEPVLACGSPGGDQQDQWQSLFLLRHVVQGASLQEAIDAPMFHTTSFPGSFAPRESEPGGLVVEDRYGAEQLEQLRHLGHRVAESGPWSLGRMCAVSRDPRTGLLGAGANPRGMQGYAVGR